MRHDNWRTILAAYRDIHRLVTSAVGDYPEKEPPQTAEQRAQQAWHSPAPVSEAPASGVPVAGPETAWPRPGTPSPVTPTGTQRYPGLWQGEPKTVPGAVPSAVRAPSTEETARFWAPDAFTGHANAAVGAAAVALARAPEPAPELAPTDQLVLATLQRDVLTRIGQLEDALAMEAGYEHAVRALVFYFDEYILAMLPEYLHRGWSLLQLKRYDTNTGGEEFFHQIQRLEKLGNTPSFVFEVHYFCLSNGFQGQYADNVAELENWKRLLRGYIAIPERSEMAFQSSPVSVDVMRSPVWYYLAAVSLVIVVTLLIPVLSN